MAKIKLARGKHIPPVMITSPPVDIRVVRESTAPEPLRAKTRIAGRRGTAPTIPSPAARPDADTVTGLPVRSTAPSDASTRPSESAAASPLAEAFAYQTELWRRSVLFLDTLRVRANNMLAHEQAGLPPLLNFDYETILDARRFEHPANYALLRITGCGDDMAEDCEQFGARPVIIIDPRAGHGPGIGGFKHDSEVGMALHEGHPTYFIIFYPEPCPGQTLADVLHALRRFVDEVSRRHDGRPPTLYGNCQAGWAIALLAATHEGLLGPAVLNGSPLSYWAGASE